MHLSSWFHIHGTNPSGLVCLLICSLTAFSAAIFLPFAPKPASESRSASLGIVAVGFFLLFWSARQLSLGAGLNLVQFIVAFWLTCSLLVGIYATWILNVIYAGVTRHQEEALLAAFLLAPLTANLLPGLLGTGGEWSTVVAWFANGICCQALCLALMPTPEVVFRGDDDPPDLGVNGCHRDLWVKFPRPRKGNFRTD